MDKHRNKNWTEHETILFLELLDPQYNKLFGKFSSKLTSQNKQAIWDDIANKLYPRCVDELKRKFTKLKSEQVKNYSAYKKKIMATGGGTPPTEPSPITMKVISLLGGDDNPRVMGIGADMDTSSLIQPIPTTPSSAVTPSSSVKKKMFETLSTQHVYEENANNGDSSVTIKRKRSPLEDQLMKQNEFEHLLRVSLLKEQISNEQLKSQLLKRKMNLMNRKCKRIVDLDDNNAIVFDSKSDVYE